MWVTRRAKLIAACHPSDIDAQIKLLKKYKTSKLDILGRLPDALASRVLAELKVSEVLDMRLVSFSEIRD